MRFFLIVLSLLSLMVFVTANSLGKPPRPPLNPIQFYSTGIIAPYETQYFPVTDQTFVEFWLESTGNFTVTLSVVGSEDDRLHHKHTNISSCYFNVGINRLKHYTLNVTNNLNYEVIYQYRIEYDWPTYVTLLIVFGLVFGPVVVCTPVVYMCVMCISLCMRVKSEDTFKEEIKEETVEVTIEN